jgi:hypothetical protein
MPGAVRRAIVELPADAVERRPQHPDAEGMGERSSAPSTV